MMPGQDIVASEALFLTFVQYSTTEYRFKSVRLHLSLTH